MAALFTREFIEFVGRLKIAARQVPARGRHALHRSASLGAGIEFRDFRPYVPGDDVRRVDWNLYLRSGRLFLRLFEETQDLPITVLLDTSDSMYFEQPPRADIARQFAAAVALIGTGQFDRVRIGTVPMLTGADTPARHGRAEQSPFPGEGHGGLSLQAFNGQASVPRLLSWLERLGPSGPADLPGALSRLGRTSRRAGLLVIVSDFFDPRGVAALESALLGVPDRLVLAQVVRATDAEPDLRGELRLIDCETDRAVDVALPGAARAAYTAAYQRFDAELARLAARRGAWRFKLDAETDIIPQLGAMFMDGLLRV